MKLSIEDALKRAIESLEEWLYWAKENKQIYAAEIRTHQAEIERLRKVLEKYREPLGDC